jgi:hypothetical protein
MSASLADHRIGVAVPAIRCEVGAAVTELIVGYVPLAAAPNGPAAAALRLAFC